MTDSSTTEVATAIDGIALSGDDFDGLDLTVSGLAWRQMVGGDHVMALTLWAAESALDPAGLPGASVTVTVSPTGGDDVTFDMIVAMAEREWDPVQAAAVIHLTLVPSTLWALETGPRLRVFRDLSVSDVIETVLAGAGLSASSDYELGLDDGVLATAGRQMVQYRESDGRFLRRLCENWGIALFVDVTRSPNVLMITDRDEAWPDNPAQELAYQTSGSVRGITALAREAVRQPDGWLARDYAPAFAREALAGRHLPSGDTVEDVDGWGIDVYSGAIDADDATYFATVRDQEAQCRGGSLSGIAGTAPLLAGTAVTVTDHPDWSDLDLIVTQVDWRWQDATLSGDCSDLVLRFTALPEAKRFRPARVTPRQPIEGLFPALVLDSDDGTDSDLPFLDDQGRYRLRLLIDDAEDAANVLWAVRMSQFHGGADRGVHFPLVPGNEVLVGFIDGHPDRPVICGAAPNPTHGSPVTSSNPTQAILRTLSAGELLIDNDLGEGETRATLYQPGYDGSDDGPLAYLRLGTGDDDVTTDADLAGTVADSLSGANVDASDYNDDGLAWATGGNMVIQAEGDRHDAVAGDSWHVVGGDLRVAIGGGADRQIDGDLTVSVAGALNETIAGDDGLTDTISAGGLTWNVAGDWDVSADGNSTLTVTGDRSISIGGKSASYYSDDTEVFYISESASITVGAYFSLGVGVSITLCFAIDTTLKLFVGFAVKYIYMWFANVGCTVKVLDLNAIGTEADVAAAKVEESGAQIEEETTSVDSVAAQVDGGVESDI